jgi:Rps23 Pro-64 3,4-dihydroxylase Tpa1-like proline 4-hydroxylase
VIKVTIIQPLDLDLLRQQYRTAQPFPFIKIDDFLDSAMAADIATSFPSFDAAASQGKSFSSVNEKKKIQITKSNLFPKSIAKLNAALASPAFLADLSYITSIPNLLADEELIGGGIHVTGPGGRLDVHVDFNFLEDRQLHRRLNILVYLNPVWDERWGGHIQLWDRQVKECLQQFAPALNRCVIFETSETSFHGVVPVAAEAPFARQSFAGYYYTREAPQGWSGKAHSTMFKARPAERLKGYVLMPVERVSHHLTENTRRVKRGIKRLLVKC